MAHVPISIKGDDEPIVFNQFYTESRFYNH